MSDLGGIIQRIERRLAILGLSPRAASVAAGLSPDAIRGIRRQFNSGIQKGISTRTVRALAVTLQTTPEWLLTGLGPENADPALRSLYADRLPFRGVINPAVWIDVDLYLNGSETETAAVPPDPRFPSTAQFCLLVDGTSVNKVAASGDYLICLDTNLYQTEIVDNDLVIASVVRTKEGLRQITARRYRKIGSSVELRIDSDDPRLINAAQPTYIPPLVLGPKSKEGYEISVRAKVVSIFRLVS